LTDEQKPDPNKVVKDLSSRVKAGIDANRQSSTKWNQLYEFLTAHFGVEADVIRASLLAAEGNLTNRVFKDNAWENPTILALICVENITPSRAEKMVFEFVETFRERMGAPPRLRLALIFDGPRLVKVLKLKPSAKTMGRDVSGASAEGDARE
jgi:hypothetical protein